MKDKLFNAAFWLVPLSLLVLLALTFSIADSNDKRQQEYENSRLRTLTSIEQAVKDIEAESNKQHGAQDKKFECLISLFITWTNNGQQPINPQDAEDCILNSKRAGSQSSSSSGSSSPSRPKPSSSSNPSNPQNPPQPPPEDFDVPLLPEPVEDIIGL